MQFLLTIHILAGMIALISAALAIISEKRGEPTHQGRYSLFLGYGWNLFDSHSNVYFH